MKKVQPLTALRTTLNDLCANAISGEWHSQGNKIYTTSLPMKAFQGWNSLPTNHLLAEVTIDKDMDDMAATELDFDPSSIAATARLMAEARTAIPALLTYIDEMEQKLDAAK